MYIKEEKNILESRILSPFGGGGGRIFRIINTAVVLLLYTTTALSQHPTLSKNPAPGDPLALRYAETISADRMSKNLHVLASDEYEGRETGKKGQKMAAEYIAAQFKSYGIPPYKTDNPSNKEGTYYQTFPLNMMLPVPAAVSVDGKSYEGNKDYYNFTGIGEQTITADKVVFLGYGIEEHTYDDYAGKDLKGKVVVILSGEPFSTEGVSLVTKTKQPSLWSTYGKVKTERAKEAGVKALLIVVDNVEKGIAENRHKLESPSLKLEANKNEMPVIYISKEMANAILKKSSTEQLATKISKKGKPLSAKAKVSLVIDIKNNIQKIEAENVLGYVEGTDLKEELVVITAHYDHLGKDGDVVFNGADDDGSGTVAVMNLAEAFALAKKEGHGPRRSILFMPVSGEEKGLLGSAYYTENPVFPLKSTICDLNIDMIGRLDEAHAKNSNYVYLIGSDKLSTQLHKINEQANKTYTGLELDYTFNDEKDKNRFYYRSDHYNFAKKGIPVIFYFNGVHADYHKETDEVQKIDFVKMEKITRLVFFTAWELANRKDRIVVDSNKK